VGWMPTTNQPRWELVGGPVDCTDDDPSTVGERFDFGTFLASVGLPGFEPGTS
jgi:hypothetical protein